MKIKYETKRIEKIMIDTRNLKSKIGLEMARMVKLRYNQIEATNNFQEYINNNIGKPHPLKGDLKGYYAIHITANYRLVVKSKENKNLIVKGVMDYHGDKYEWIIP